MAFIDPKSNGRLTLHNCSTYDVPKVYAYTADVEMDVVRSVYGSGEVERTGQTTTEERTYHIVANSTELAAALVKNRWGSPHQRHTPKSITLLFTLDASITVNAR